MFSMTVFVDGMKGVNPFNHSDPCSQSSARHAVKPGGTPP